MVLVIHGGRVMGFWWGHGVPSRRVVVWGGGEILIKTYPGTNLCPPPSYPIRPPAAPFSLFLSFHPSLPLAFSLSPIPSPLFSFSCSLALPSLTHTFLPSSPPRYTRPSVAPAVLNPGSRMEKGFSAPRRESFGCCSQREAEDTFFVSRLCNTTDGVLF